MPELPEVEVIARRLRLGCRTEPAIVGRTVARARVLSTKTLREPKRASFLTKIAGARIVDVKRRAKHILVETDHGVLMLHLRMTGDLHVVKESETPRFLRIALELDGGHALAFTDSRHLGTARFVDDAASHLVDLGPEPLDDAFTVAVLAEILHGDKRAVKAVLLDQTSVAGLGNIYSDEACYVAKIHPATPATSLDPASVARLHAAIRATLQASLDAILADDGDIHWRYASKSDDNPFLVYDRAGAPCKRCGTVLKSARIAARTSVWCPTCQNITKTKTKTRTKRRRA